MAWQKASHNTNQQARKGKECWQRRWTQKTYFQSLGPVTKPLPGAAPFFFNSKWLWNRKEIKGMWSAVSGTEHNYTVKQRMVGPTQGRQGHQGMHRASTGQDGTCWAGVPLFYQSRVQKTNPNFEKLYHYGTLLPQQPPHLSWCWSKS